MQMPSLKQPDFEIDKVAMSRFVDVVFGHLEGFVPVRAFAEKGTSDKPAVIEFHEPHALAEALHRMGPQAARDFRGLYVVPATVAGPGTAKVEDIIQTGVLVVDIDAGDIDVICHYLVAHLGEPSLVVASGGVTAAGQTKRHLYWKLSEAACGDDLECVRSLREEIARKVNGDLSFGRLHQPIRVPGSIHGKNGRRTPVRNLVEGSCEYELGDLAERVEAMPPIKPTVGDQDAPQATSTIRVADLATKRVRENCVDGISRFDALSKVIGHWVRNVRFRRCTLQEAWIAVQDHNAAQIAPPWDEARLFQDFEAILKRDIATNGPMPTNEETKIPVLDGLAVACSDDAIALEFVDCHGRDWRHTAAWGAWFVWQDGKWQRDEISRVREQMRLVCRDAASSAEKANEARRLSSEKTISAALRIASSDQRVATRPSDWDAQPWLLNTPAGVVDLETGEIREHDPFLLIAQITSASPGGGCPRWMAFLDEITNGDLALQSYLARFAGYCLTGATSEQVFAFLHGSGANGKSVFIGTIAAIMGDYAVTATNETFMASRADRHLTELAGLRAARLVVVPETEQGRAWAEGRIKSVTGGEKIRANYMRQDHFEFTPEFKLVVAGNHRPALSGVGEAMRRRLHLVPFEVTIPVEQRDKDLAVKLFAERDGILAWMIGGCAEWQKTRLAPPERVQAAAKAYFEDEDIVGQWLEECCDTGEGHRSTARDLFSNWSGWADLAGHPVGSQKSLGTALRERGFVGRKVQGERGWIGLRLRKTLRSAGE